MSRKLLTLISLLGSIAVAPSAMAGITSIGSNSLEPFLKQWAAKAGGEVDISSPGTSSAPKALISGKADLAAMNREMTNDESEAFIRVHGYHPTGIAVAIEAVALYVHPDNPIKGLEYKQLDGIFSSSHGCGWNENIAKWGQLGLSAPWDQQPIVLLGLDKKSAVRDFFNKSVLCRDDFKPEIEELSHEQLLAKVAQNKNALGYSRYQPDSKLKMVPLKKGADEFVALTPANLHNKSYRLQHFLYLYINKPHGKPVPAAVADFLRVGLSREGQAAVEDAGYVPLSDELIRRQLNKLK
jgi:phosphate transport system substrate-binding protein